MDKATKRLMKTRFLTFMMTVIFLQSGFALAEDNKGNTEQQKQMQEARIHFDKAESYLTGTMQLQSYAEAIKEYRKAQTLGSTLASEKLVRLTQIMAHDPSLETNYRETLEKAKENNGDAQFNVAEMCEFGIGVDTDLSRAVFWYKKAAEQNQGEAQNRLAELYTAGLIGVDNSVSEEQASEWIQAAAKNGQPEAQYKLGKVYLEGNKRFAKDEAKAFYWFEQSAQNGNIQGQMQAGMMLKEGQGVKRDYEKALHWFQQAANQGYAPAEEQAKEVNTILDDEFLKNFKYKEFL